VGFCRWEEPTVNHRTIDRGYRLKPAAVARATASSSGPVILRVGNRFASEFGHEAVSGPLSVDGDDGPLTTGNGRIGYAIFRSASRISATSGCSFRS
jgi:hypothetical protein